MSIRWTCCDVKSLDCSSAPTAPLRETPCSSAEMLSQRRGGRRESVRHSTFHSGQEFLYHPSRFDAGELGVEALEFEAEALVVEAEAVEDGGVKVTDVDAVNG